MLDIMDDMDDYDPEEHNSYLDNQHLSNGSVFITNTHTQKKVQHHSLHRVVPGDPCRVCGFEKNTGRNFGVISCSTCKAFFRRNGRNSAALPACRFGGHCPVNERTRRQCPTCRLAKCFAVGMQKDLIRTDEERAARLQLVKANRLQRHEKNILNSDQQSRLRTQELSSLSLPHSDKSSPLSSNDWIQLSNLRSAYEHFCLHPTLRAEEQREEYLSRQPMKCRLKEHSFMDVLTVRLSSLVAFFRATIPVFSAELSSDDRAWLVRTNLHYLLGFASMDLMLANGHRVHFESGKCCHAVYVHVYGQDFLLRAQQLIYKLSEILGFDPAISKIFQIILFLSPSLVTNFLPQLNTYQPNIDTILRVAHAQEQYTKILWSYFVYRHGEIEAQKLLLAIVGQTLRHQKYGADLDDALVQRQPFGNLVYSMLSSFSLN